MAGERGKLASQTTIKAQQQVGESCSRQQREANLQGRGRVGPGGAGRPGP